MATAGTARKLRAESTDAEQRLWSRLRNRRLLDHKFRRQVRIGRFVTDFACEKARLVVEVDGGQHAGQLERDALRTAFLEKAGFLVLRFWNNEVLNETDAVVERIAAVLRVRDDATLAPPLPKGEGFAP